MAWHGEDQVLRIDEESMEKIHTKLKTVFIFKKSALASTVSGVFWGDSVVEEQT
jgi:hypothetical protein